MVAAAAVEWREYCAVHMATEIEARFVYFQVAIAGAKKGVKYCTYASKSETVISNVTSFDIKCKYDFGKVLNMNRKE